MLNQKSGIFSLLFIGLMISVSCKQEDKNKKIVPPQVMILDSATGGPARLPNPWKNEGCSLVTDEEIIDLFNIEVKPYAFNSRTLPNRGFCLRSWHKPDWKERESRNEKPDAGYVDSENTLVTQVLDYGTEVVSKDQFEMVRQDQRHIYEKDVPGLGDGAVWSTAQRSLMIKKGHLVVKITLEYTDDPKDNLPLARKVAELALRKMY